MTSRTRVVTVSLVFLLALALFGWTIVERALSDGARRDEQHATAVASARADQAAAAWQTTRDSIASVRELNTLSGAVQQASDIDAQVVAAVAAAVDAGLRGDVAGFNAVVTKLNGLNAATSTSWEALRKQVNAALAALDPVTR